MVIKNAIETKCYKDNVVRYGLIEESSNYNQKISILFSPNKEFV